MENRMNGPREIGVFFGLGVGCGRVDTEHPENRLFFVSAITSGVDANGGELASFAPTFDGEGRNTEDRGDFGDRKEIGEIVQIKIFLDCFDDWGLVLIVHFCYCLI